MQLSDKKMLVFQGGGALGAYQAGAYEALHIAGLEPEWIAGISIGAINAAIVAGSPSDKRVKNLRAFWEMVTSGPAQMPLSQEASLRGWFNHFSAAYSASIGVAGFFNPRYLDPFKSFNDPLSQISFYDTSPLIATLKELVDFDLINSGEPRLSVGAVEVQTGNFEYFDSVTLGNEGGIHPEHIAASGALPPGFPPVKIKGRYYWDGGLVSNTPLNWIMSKRNHAEDICVFQIDLFNARGRLPRNLAEVSLREKEIRFSSRTRMNTDQAERDERARRALKRLLAALPDHMANDPDVVLLKGYEDGGATTVVHLIYERRPYESSNMDAEFSRATMEDHWRAGYDDAVATLNCRSWKERKIPEDGFVTIDRRREHKKG
ncbi:patatin-like phospholipase family protein [Rhizobium sp. L1K21]|uniref:DUF3734 domain-containing protein n=1 Tax=Rhizobium sp. L1K21 TaxID=2954933 RepID=UPI0020927350|nr:patatin-like phospholipase family protein [Rhizobium sp. L1K21]MCO6187024.1 patatin-like phospholipase family protein [Rhizobium sp. L1K21]